MSNKPIQTYAKFLLRKEIANVTPSIIASLLERNRGKITKSGSILDSQIIQDLHWYDNALIIAKQIINNN